MSILDPNITNNTTEKVKARQDVINDLKQQIVYLLIKHNYKPYLRFELDYLYKSYGDLGDASITLHIAYYDGGVDKVMEKLFNLWNTVEESLGEVYNVKIRIAAKY